MDRNPQVAIGGPKLVYKDGGLQLSCRPFPHPLNIAIEGTFLKKYLPNSRFVKEYTMEEWDHATQREVDWMYGACLIIRKEALHELGLFDPNFFYLYEDIDLCYRAKKLGWRILYVPEAVICHHLEREERSIFNRTIFVHVRSIIRYLSLDYLGLRRFSKKGWTQ
jgi:GT2 family glycosyltransferase